MDEEPTLRVGESGAVYFEIAGAHYGPGGPRGVVTRDVALSPDAVQTRYDIADLSEDEDLSTYVAELRAADQ